MTLRPDVQAVVDAVDDRERHADCLTIIEMMGRHSGKPAYVAGRDMIGFGRIRYKYPTGNTGITFLTGFAPRKNKLSLHVFWYEAKDDPLLSRLGKHKSGVGCLYIKRLADVDLDVLDQIIKRSATELAGRFIVEHLED